MSHHPLARLGWRADLQDQIPDGHVPARVLAVDRGSVVVDAGDHSWRAPLAGRLRTMPATGDFVAALPDGPVRAVLPRRGVIARRGNGGRAEVLAANVDLALLATSPNRDLNPRRLARFLAITARGEVDAVVLLTKSDLVPDPAEVAARVHAGLDGTPVVPVSAVDGTGHGRAARAARTRPHRGHARHVRRRQVDAAQRPARRGAAVDAADPRRRRPRPPHDGAARAGAAPGRRLLIDTPGLRLVAPLEDADEDVPMLDKAALKRERRVREREFHRGIYREMRARKRDRERREGR